jgi:TPR repeat protein
MLIKNYKERDMLQEAHKAYNEKDYAKALELYTILADKGDADAQTSLAYMYQMGHGVERDDLKAFTLYERAIEKKQPYALFNMALLYDGGLGGVVKNPIQAHALFLEAAIGGVPEAQYQVALQFERGLTCAQNASEAAFWYEEAAKRGHAEAFNNLGVLYKEGVGVEQNYHRAFVCFSRASEKGLAVAQYNLGQLYDAGLGVEVDHDKALELCRKAAYGGHQKAKDIISKLQQDGKITF